MGYFQTMIWLAGLMLILLLHPSVTDQLESLSSPGFREKITGLAKFPLGRLSFCNRFIPGGTPCLFDKTWPIVENAGFFIAFLFSPAKWLLYSD